MLKLKTYFLLFYETYKEKEKKATVDWKELLDDLLNEISRVLLLRQLWIVNYYVKSLWSILSNESINTGVSREMIFQK